MVCKVADFTEIRELEKDLELKHTCQSARGACIQGFNMSQSEKTYGIVGTAIGYCQGLFNVETGNSPKQHTEFITKMLQSMGFPWKNSHELIFNQKPDGWDLEEFMSDATKPLGGKGRVPILITELDPHSDKVEVDNIFYNTSSVGKEQSPILVRLSLNSQESIHATTNLINRIFENAMDEKQLPNFLPLLQSGENFSGADWHKLKKDLGSNWKYAFLAAHPLSTEMLFDDGLKDNVKVAQWLVGKPGKINSNGDVGLHTLGCTTLQEGTYNVLNYANQLNESGIEFPVNIVCGASLPNWSNKQNVDRLEKFLPLFKEGMKKLIPSSRYDIVMSQ